MDKVTFHRLFHRMLDNQATQQEVLSLIDAMEADPPLSRLFRELVAAEFEGMENAPSWEQLSAAMRDSVNRTNEENEENDLTARLQNQWEKILARTHGRQQMDHTADKDDCYEQKADDNSSASASLSASSSLDAELKVGSRSSNRSLLFRIAAVMVLLIGLGWGVNYYFQSRTRPAITKIQQKTAEPIVLVPGTDAAVLTLDNGEQVALDSSTGSAIRQKEQLLAHNTNGQLDYQIQHPDQTDVQYNTLTTKKGNQYKLVLPDGTKVWLNAESSIRFPTAFTGDTRNVSLTGEAYFEVHHDAGMPFKVNVSGQVIEDIGTSFNINAYKNESALRATLVEGAIRIQDQLISPGQQAVVDADGHLQVEQNADIAQIVGWKQGMFVFHQMDMKAILRQVARWYNVEIVYEGEFNQTFTGGISRGANAEEVLKILGYSEKVKFSINGRKIIVQQRHK